MDGLPRGAVYRFDRFTLDLDRGALLAADGAEITLRPKSLTLLRYLVENPGRLIGRDELMRILWPGTFVTEDSIGQCVKEVRRALGDDGQRWRSKGSMTAQPTCQRTGCWRAASPISAPMRLPGPPRMSCTPASCLATR